MRKREFKGVFLILSLPSVLDVGENKQVSLESEYHEKTLHSLSLKYLNKFKKFNPFQLLSFHDTIF